MEVKCTMSEGLTVNLGDTLFIIDGSKKKEYKQECKVCRGTKSVTVNNVTFPCPVCEFNRHSIVIYQYQPIEMEVSEITIKKLNYNHKVSILLVSKEIVEHQKLTKVVSGDKLLNVNIQPNDQDLSSLVHSDYYANTTVFSNRIQAGLAATKLNVAEQDRLFRYNDTNKTQLKYPKEWANVTNI